MSVQTIVGDALEKLVESARTIQGAGFRAANAVAEKSPGLPRPVATAVVKVSQAWYDAYSRFVENVVEAGRHTTAQAVAFGNAVVSPRSDAVQEEAA